MHLRPRAISVLHPLDVRAGAVDLTRHTRWSYLLYRAGIPGPPPVAALLATPPGTPLARHPEDAPGPTAKPSDPPFPLAIDHLAVHTANQVVGASTAGKLDPELDAWINGLSPELSERLSIAHASQVAKIFQDRYDGMVDSNDPLVPAALEICRRPACLHALPTVDRLLSPMLSHGHVMTPMDVANLRRDGWEDAAGRDIDGFLYAGIHHAMISEGLHDPIPELHQPDQALASRIDALLPSVRRPLANALRCYGMILPSAVVKNLRAGDLNPRLNLPEDDPNHLLALDRVNRLQAREGSHGRHLTGVGSAAPAVTADSAPTL